MLRNHSTHIWLVSVDHPLQWMVRKNNNSTLSPERCLPANKQTPFLRPARLSLCARCSGRKPHLTWNDRMLKDVEEFRSNSSPIQRWCKCLATLWGFVPKGFNTYIRYHFPSMAGHWASPFAKLHTSTGDTPCKRVIWICELWLSQGGLSKQILVHLKRGSTPRSKENKGLVHQNKQEPSLLLWLEKLTSSDAVLSQYGKKTTHYKLKGIQLTL